MGIPRAIKGAVSRVATIKPYTPAIASICPSGIDTSLPAIRALPIRTPYVILRIELTICKNRLSYLHDRTQRGALFETWLVSELLKTRYKHAMSSNLYYWRDHTGNEVDILIEQSNCLVPVEVKSGQTVTADSLKGLDYWVSLAGNLAGKPWLVYGGDQNQARSKANIVSWRHMSELLSYAVK